MKLLLLLIAGALLIGAAVPQCSTVSSVIINAWPLGHCVFQPQAGKQHERAHVEGHYGTGLSEARVLTFAPQWRALSHVIMPYCTVSWLDCMSRKKADE